MLLDIDVLDRADQLSEIWLKWWTDIDGHQTPLYASIYLLLALGFSVGEAGYAW